MSSSSPDEAAGIPIQKPSNDNDNDNETQSYVSDLNIIETVNSKGDMVFYVSTDDKHEVANNCNTPPNSNSTSDGKNNGGTSESSKTDSSEESAVMVEREDAQQDEQQDAQRGLVEAVTEGLNDTNDPVNHQTTAKIASVSLTTGSLSDSQQRPPSPHSKGTSRISSFIHPSTPIPNSDSSLRLLRKFINKTSRHFPTTFGGTKPPSLINYLFGTHNVEIPDPCSHVYKHLVDVISASSTGNDDEYPSQEENKKNSSDHTMTTSTDSENEVVLESIFGHSGDTMSKARQAIAAFCRLVETWCLETQRIRIVEMGEDLSDFVEDLEQSFYYPLQLVSEDDSGEQYPNDGISERALYSVNTVVTSELMSIALSTAEALVAHGCFDGVIVGVGKEQSVNSSFDLRIMPSITEETEEDGNGNGRGHSTGGYNGNKTTSVEDDPLKECLDEPKFENAVTVLAESIFLIYIDSEQVELSSLKFLLTTGCRTTVSESSGHAEAMLRGSHLLQTIRMCYRVYLSTQSEANKTTARAALRQIVTSAFKRLDFKTYDGSKEEAKIIVKNSTVDPFSQPQLFDENENDLGRKSDDRSTAGMSYGAKFSSFEHKDAYLVLRSLCKLSMKATIGGGAFQNVVVVHDDNMRSIENGPSSRGNGLPKQEIMMDPALDSKILALDLLVEILQGTKTEVLQNAGPQLIYAVRNYLCHSLLKNCTSDNNYVVSLSLRLFVPLIRHFRSHLKTEIEAFVTNVFFVILDSKNSTIEHKLRVVILFEEICSDPATLAEIFLNYDCDLSAVDLFQRIVNTLARVAKIGLHDQGMNAGGIFVAGAGVSRAEKSRQDHRELRLEAMKAVRQVLSSLHESFVIPDVGENDQKLQKAEINEKKEADEIDTENKEEADGAAGGEKKSLVQIYDSKKKRREEEAKATLRFNQKPTAGIKFASEVGLIDGDDPADVAQFLLGNKDVLDKTQIGEYLGREPDYQDGYPLKVLHQYLNLLDFNGLLFDDAIKFYLSGFRLPGEAQKIDRIMEKFAERYTTQNPDIFPTADAAFILAFSIIMLNTDLHNPAIKEERRMTKEGFLRNNSGICNGKDLPAEFLSAIFDRIKTDPISLKEDDELREKASEGKLGNAMKSPNAGLFANNFSEMDKKRESEYQKERDQILRSTESLLRRKKKKGVAGSGPVREIGKFVSTEDSGLKYEYVIPMFDVTWGPALAVFSTVIESANGTMGTLLSIATDREIEAAAENAASATEICLSGFCLAIRIAALCGNDTARSAYVHALSNFSLLGTGRLLEHRHIRCVQTLLELARDDGELLGSSWEYVFKALSEISRLNQVHEATVKAHRVEAEAYERKMNRKKKEAAKRADTSMETSNEDNMLEDESIESEDMDSFDDNDYEFEEEMDKKAIDETNARIISDAIPDDIRDTIYVRSGNLSIEAIKDFVFQLCRVSRMEIAGYGGHVGSKANDVDLTAVHYRKQHTLLTNAEDASGRYNQPDIYSLQKLVEVTHYNMDSRPRLIFAEIWHIVSSHLTSTCLHDNAAVAIYAVDSFRQLSLQFLQREELGVFEFQRRFLRPFEAVMSQCKKSSVKEFLLKAIEQIILMFEPGDTDQDFAKKRQKSIGSGWRPILTVIGLASLDEDDAIANLGFSMLTKQLRQSLHIKKTGENEATFSIAAPLRADKFVDLIDALLMYTSGPREEKSSISIDHLVTIARYLADENIPLPQRSVNTFIKDDNQNTESITKSLSMKENSEELELWWPLLLGLSKSVGDVRPNIRIKGLVTLLAIINQHFFQSPTKQHSGVLGEIQTLQLIFKGILTPALEHAETSLAVSGQKIPLPDGFIRFMTRGSPVPEATTNGGRKNRIEQSDTTKGNNWIDTTFDHLMDGSISLALKSLELYKDDILIEEVLAMFNNCLVSDSAILVIRGMKRLHHFVTSDLSLDIVSENTWATVCHMLRRCMSVRGLLNDYDSSGEQSEQEHNQLVREFLQEEEIFPARRYIGSNAAMIIGTILNDKQVVERMGTRWYMFLLTGLGAGIKAWDRAAAIFDSYPLKTIASNDAAPPQYAESSLYARKWVIRVLVRQLNTADVLSVAQTSGLLKDEFESLVSIYLKKEIQESNSGTSPGLLLEMEHMAKMICDLLEAIGGMKEEDFVEISTLTPTLSACIQINDKAIRTAVHGLLQKIFQSSLLGGNTSK